jgi:hypothetical protein
VLGFSDSRSPSIFLSFYCSRAVRKRLRGAFLAVSEKISPTASLMRNGLLKPYAACVLSSERVVNTPKLNRDRSARGPEHPEGLPSRTNRPKLRFSALLREGEAEVRFERLAAH